MFKFIRAHNRVLQDGNLVNSIEEYLDIPSILSFSETYNQSGLFSKNQYWKERYRNYFDADTATYKCYETAFKCEYEKLVYKLKRWDIHYSDLNNSLKNDVYIGLLALMLSIENSKYLDKSLLHNKEFLLQAIPIDFELYTSRIEIFFEDLDLAKIFAKKYPHSFEYLPDSLKTSPEIINIICETLGLTEEQAQQITHVQQFSEFTEVPRLQRLYQRAYVVEEINLANSGIRFR